MGRKPVSSEVKARFNIYVDTDRLLVGEDHKQKAVLVKVLVHRDVIGRWGLYLVADGYEREPALAQWLKGYDKLTPENQESYLADAIVNARNRLITDYTLRTKVFGEKSRPSGDYRG